RPWAEAAELAPPAPEPEVPSRAEANWEPTPLVYSAPRWKAACSWVPRFAAATPESRPAAVYSLLSRPVQASAAAEKEPGLWPAEAQRCRAIRAEETPCPERKFPREQVTIASLAKRLKGSPRPPQRRHRSTNFSTVQVWQRQSARVPALPGQPACPR